MNEELLKIAQGLSEIVRIADEESFFTKSDFEAVAGKIALLLRFSADDWMWKESESETAYPSETASIALTERDTDGNIVRAGIAALYGGFPIVVADKTGCYLYEDGKLVPVVSVNKIFTDDPEIPIRCHIFGQKSTTHWVLMNRVIGFLNERKIRTDNNMGPYFLLRNFFFYRKEIEGGIEIAPMKTVISEPFSNKPKEEIVAFIIKALNQGLLAEERFILTDMSGGELFCSGEMGRVDGCNTPYCAAGWIAGTSYSDVQRVLRAIKEAVGENPPPDLSEDDPSKAKIDKLIRDLNHLQI